MCQKRIEGSNPSDSAKYLKSNGKLAAWSGLFFARRVGVATVRQILVLWQSACHTDRRRSVDAGLAVRRGHLGSAHRGIERHGPMREQSLDGSGVRCDLAGRVVVEPAAESGLSGRGPRLRPSYPRPAVGSLPAWCHL